MLHVDYTTKYGFYMQTIKYGGKTETYRIDLCSANCLWAEMDFDNETPRLAGFASDIEHLKRCITAGVLDNCDYYTFYMEELTNDLWKAIKILARNGKQVLIRKSGN